MSDNLEALRALRGPGCGKPRVLENASFVNTEFAGISFGLGDPPDALVRVRNCSFSHCTSGPFLVMPGVELDRVVLDNVESSDSVTIDTHTVLREVIVKGSPMIGGLWVKPILDDRAMGDDPLAQRLQRCSQWAVAASQSTEWMLDFSEFDAPHTEVVGLPLSKLKWNRERHVALRMEWTESEKDRWRRLDLPVTSFWTRCMGRLKSFGATEGVFLMPLRWTKRYAQANEEKMQVMDAGFLVSPE